MNSLKISVDFLAKEGNKEIEFVSYVCSSVRHKLVHFRKKWSSLYLSKFSSLALLCSHPWNVATPLDNAGLVGISIKMLLIGSQKKQFGDFRRQNSRDGEAVE